MARAYLSAAVRCRQLERLVRHAPGSTIPELRAAAMPPLSYQSVCSYMQRLVREQRVDVSLADPALGAKSEQRFYPRGLGPKPPLRRAA